MKAVHSCEPFSVTQQIRRYLRLLLPRPGERASLPEPWCSKPPGVDRFAQPVTGNGATFFGSSSPSFGPERSYLRLEVDSFTGS